MEFDDPSIHPQLDELDEGALDALDFGVVAMDQSHQVVAYNAAECRLSGLSAERVKGSNFFESVAPCTNNYLVSQRFVDETTLDETIDYVFTVKMRPTPVRLRLLKSPQGKRLYLLVEKR